MARATPVDRDVAHCPPDQLGWLQARAVKKELAALDGHCRHFIALSPQVILATGDAAHRLDASPRGREPGFVQVSADGALLIPDAPGNKRLNSFENIVDTGQVGLLFLIPRFDDTLRINGQAWLSTDPPDLAACTSERRALKLVVRVSVTAAYLHCAKALMRSRLWQASSRVDRVALPSAGRMISDQTGIVVAPETQEASARRCAPAL